MGPSWRCPNCGFTPEFTNGVLRFHDAANGGFEARFFKDLARLEPGFWWFEARNALIRWALSTYGKPSGDFLEIGCGTGFVAASLAHAFPSWNIAASEFFAEGLEFVAERITRASLYQIDARNLPFSAAFDAIGAFDVIEHIADDRGVLNEARRALRDAGLIIITVPQHPFLWSAIDEYTHHERRYTRAELRLKLEEAGFEVLLLRSFVSLLMPLLLATRLRPVRGPVDPEAEFRIAPQLNSLLHGVMRLEGFATRAGFVLPFGGSLLAVGRAR